VTPAVAVVGIDMGSPVGLRAPRRIEDLRWVQPRTNPWPKSRLRGSRAAGLRYQRAVARAIPVARADEWFEFLDRHGVGCCSPDLILVGSRLVFALECKLTAVPQADAQLAGLYLPVLAHHFGREARGIVVVRHLRPQVDLSRVRADLKSCIRDATATYFPILHWLGRGPI
jgi:hypothetical protein